MVTFGRKFVQPSTTSHHPLMQDMLTTLQVTEKYIFSSKAVLPIDGRDERVAVVLAEAVIAFFKNMNLNVGGSPISDAERR